ncbi:uncharacterized protein LOC144448258 isoform X2 [Glandiceps talaboti]
MDDKPANQRPAVLIISDRWGSPFQNGTPAVVRLLAYLFNKVGLSVFCTVLKMTDEEYADANRNNVELIPPNPRGLLKRGKPNLQWLLAFEAYFPKLFTIDNVEIGVGFSFVTSDAAREIINEVFHVAKYYIVNIWPSDVHHPVVGCDRDELRERLVNLGDECNDANALISLDETTFEDFKQRFGDLAAKHFQVSLAADNVYLGFTQPTVRTQDQRCQILSFLEEYDLKEMHSHRKLAKAINKVAETFHTMLLQPPRWKILSIPEAKESHYRRKLNPHPHLKVVPSSMPAVKYMEREIYCSHLILIPGEPGMNSIQLMLYAMAIGIPFLVSMHSPCHDLIRKHFPDHEYCFVVDMEDGDKFKDRISLILQKPAVYFKLALEVKDRLATTVIPSMKDMNDTFMNKVKQDLQDAKSSQSTANLPVIDRLTTPDDNPSGNKSEGAAVDLLSDRKEGIASELEEAKAAVSPAADLDDANPATINQESTSTDASLKGLAPGNGSNQSTVDQDKPHVNPGNEAACANGSLTTTSKEENRLPGHMHLHVNAVGGIPKEGVSISEVEQAYFQSPEVQEELPEHINNIHPDLHVDNVGGNSVWYSIACESLDALECLWKEYEALNLNKLVTSTTITEKTLKEIGAMYFSIQTTLDIEEYEQCRKELIETGETSVTVSTTSDVDDNEESTQRETELTKENSELRLETCKLKTTVNSLQKQMIQYEARIQILNTALKENADLLKVDQVTLQARLKEKDIEIEILRKNQEENEKRENVLMDKIIQLSKEISKLKESSEKGGDPSLSEENRQLKEEVISLKEKVEDLEKTNITKQQEIERLEEMEMDKIKGSYMRFRQPGKASYADVTLRQSEKMSDEIWGLAEAGSDVRGQQARTKQYDDIKGQWKVTMELDGQSGPVKFKDVYGVTTNHLGQVVMADGGNNSVLTLKSTYELDSEIRFDGHFPNKFKPYDVAMTTSNKYFMTDSGNDQVVMFDISSKTTQTFCQNDDIKPRAIALLDEGFVVTDDKGHRVVKYDMNGESVAEVGRHVQPSLLYDPKCVVVNSDNNVIVSDHGRSVDDGSIKVFGKQLQYLFTMCSHVWRPYGLSVDLWDNVYNTQYTRGPGRLIVKYTKNGEEVERFRVYPHCDFIAVSKYGQPKIIVSYPYNNRVRVYTK